MVLDAQVRASALGRKRRATRFRINGAVASPRYPTASESQKTCRCQALLQSLPRRYRHPTTYFHRQRVCIRQHEEDEARKVPNHNRARLRGTSTAQPRKGYRRSRVVGILAPRLLEGVPVAATARVEGRSHYCRP